MNKAVDPSDGIRRAVATALKMKFTSASPLALAIYRPTPHWNRADQASRFVIYIQDQRHWIVDQALGPM
eukprot:scaffold60949_cov54-Phaeocystis_antarctica.AAC.1